MSFLTSLKNFFAEKDTPSDKGTALFSWEKDSIPTNVPDMILSPEEQAIEECNTGRGQLPKPPIIRRVKNAADDQSRSARYGYNPAPGIYTLGDD